MKATAEICKNCEHQQPAVNEPRNHRHCLVWNRLTYVNETCHLFELKSELVPKKVAGIMEFLKKFDEVQKRTAKSKLQLP